MPRQTKNLPMLVTFSRMFVAPWLFVLLFWDNIFWAEITTATLFVIASLTDWLDGHLARRLNAQSNLGKFMDPIADKILVLAALIVLLQLNRIDPYMVFVLISRDIFVGGIRSTAATSGLVIDAKSTGKLKTALQMALIPCLFLETTLQSKSLTDLAYYALWITVLLSLKSGWDYTMAYFHQGRTKH